MARYLLDSDAIIDHLRRRADSVRLIEGLFEQGESLCSCDVVVSEVYAGIRPEDQVRAEELVERLEYLTTSRAAAVRAGQWRYAYARRGIALPVYDALIAAVAYSAGATIVTGNIRDYPMPEVSLLPLPR